MMRFVAFLVVLCHILAAQAVAHGGGLDSLGCHNDRKNGGYHCHRGTLAGLSFKSKEEAEKALRSLKETEKPQNQPKANRGQ